MLYFAKWKIATILAVILAGFFYAFPNVGVPLGQRDLPEWWQPVNLGLDLQGGSYLLLEVGVEEVVAEQLSSLVEGARDGLRDARIRYRDLGVVQGAVEVRIPEADQIDAARRLLDGLDNSLILTTGEGGLFRLSYSEQALNERKIQAVQQSIEIVRRRVDELGTREPNIQRQGDSRIIVELPGVDDPERIKRLIGQTARLNFHLVDHTVSPEDALRGRVPPGSRLVPAANPGSGQAQYVVRRSIVVSGDRLTDSQPTFEDGRPVVSFRFDTLGGKRFGDATSENVGRLLAIVLDDKVISAPQIRQPILGGSGVITGQFTVQEAQDLALLLRAGALPAPLTVLEERTVGPGLGEDSIRAGIIACAIGMALVVVFMIAAYGTFGVFANICLLLNLVLLVGALSALGATLTLPGIAGIVLTVGMAVDANILIFERIREEFRNGRTAFAAAETGFRQAFKTILDSNITTLIAALMLFQFGTGPVKGFAVTLAIGILTSMFTAIMVNRLMVSGYLRSRKTLALPQ